MSTETIELTSYGSNVLPNRVLEYAREQKKSEYKRQVAIHETDSQAWIFSNLHSEAFASLSKALIQPNTGLQSLHEATAAIERENDMEYDFHRISVQINWKHIVQDSPNVETVISVIRFLRFDLIADRLAYLNTLIKNDPDARSIDLESLQRFAYFIMDKQTLPKPQIGINSSGLVHVAWRIGDRGILAMDFLPSGSIRFAAILRPSGSDSQEWSKDGILSPDHMWNDIRPFIEQLMHVDDRNKNSKSPSRI